MYSLANFIPHSGNEHKLTNGMHKVLVWSKKSGYYFCEFGFVVGDVLIIGIEEV